MKLMLFNEIYGSYFNVVAAILEEALSGGLDGRRLMEIVQEKAFADSVLSLPAALKSGEWPLLDEHLCTPIRHTPTMPLTTLQKRWMKALLTDPRIKLFNPAPWGLEEVEPLYTQDAFEYFDRYTDGDPYEDEAYIEHFRTVLAAFKEQRKLSIQFEGRDKTRHTWECLPYKLEYSPKDDKFRLITASTRGNILTINIARITACALLGHYQAEEYQPPTPAKALLVMELTDERNALERAMLHFSHLEKETERLDKNRYRLTLRYQHDDETELLIRVLSFGPLLRVLEPDSFIALIRERLARQEAFLSVQSIQ